MEKLEKKVVNFLKIVATVGPLYITEMEKLRVRWSKIMIKLRKVVWRLKAEAKEIQRTHFHEPYGHLTLIQVIYEITNSIEKGT